MLMPCTFFRRTVIAHWTKNLDMNITLYVVHFEEEVGSLLYVIEKAVSERLIPHCGSH
jgi:glutathionyl-hydroquinone reductase